MTWPLVLTLDRAVIASGDPELTTWILDWDWYATFHQPLHLFQANAFYPAKNSLAFTENLYGIALVVFPLRALGATPLFAHNVALLLGLAFSAFGACVLGRTIGASWIGAIAAGIFYAYVPWRMIQLPHIQHVWGGWLAIALAALLVYARTPTWRNAILFDAAFLMNGLTNIHWLLMGSLALAFSAVIAVRAPKRLIVTSAIAFALLVAFLYPYTQVAKQYGMQRQWDETKYYSATLRDWLNPGILTHVYARFAHPDTDAEKWLFPGILGIALSLAGLAFGRRDHRAIAILWIALGFVGSLGLHAFLHRFLFAHVPGFRALRVPARWANIAFLGMSMLIALSVTWMESKRRALGYVAAILFLIELNAAPIRWHMLAPAPRDVDRFIAEHHARVIELPIGGRWDYAFMFHATAHHQPLVNGASGFVPPEQMRVIERASPDYEGLIEELHRIGVDTVIVHADLLDPLPARHVRAWLRRELDAHRLQFVDRFDAGIQGDWVFTLNGPAKSDAMLDRFLNEQLTPSRGTIASLDYPVFAETISGNALFSGWAVSPIGIKKVDLLFNCGRVRLPTQLVEDRGLSQGMPWYPKTPRPRFIAPFAQRPASIPIETEVQVEITDARGQKKLLEGVPINWIR